MILYVYLYRGNKSFQFFGDFSPSIIIIIIIVLQSYKMDIYIYISVLLNGTLIRSLWGYYSMVRISIDDVLTAYSAKRYYFPVRMVYTNCFTDGSTSGWTTDSERIPVVFEFEKRIFEYDSIIVITIQYPVTRIITEFSTFSLMRRSRLRVLPVLYSSILQ